MLETPLLFKCQGKGEIDSRTIPGRHTFEKHTPLPRCLVGFAKSYVHMGVTIYTTAVQDFMKYAQVIISSDLVQFIGLLCHNNCVASFCSSCGLQARETMSYMIMIPIYPNKRAGCNTKVINTLKDFMKDMWLLIS